MSGGSVGTAGADESGERPPSNDVLYDVLADQRRRYALHYLKQEDGPVSVRELAERVAAWENGKTVPALDSQERKRVYIAMYQSHLPSMDELGLVEYDEDAGTVELRAALDDADIYIEVVPEADIPWDRYYLGLSVAHALLLALAWIDVRPFGAVPDIAVGAVIVATVAASAVGQMLVDTRKRFGEDGPPPGVEVGD